MIINSNALVLNIVLILFLYCLQIQAKITKARAYIYRAQKSVEKDGGLNFSGFIDFLQIGENTVLINGSLTQILPKGLHGFHIHQFGLIDDNCIAAGSHFNAENKTHGSPVDKNRHIGDLGNIISDDYGKVLLSINDTKISLNGPNSIIGRTVVIHENVDDLGKSQHKDSLKTGNAGKRLACGLIGLAQESEN